MDNLDYFQVGGTLSYRDNSYVVRQADQKLLTHLGKGDFCFVLNCRQMGKSSLMIQTANKLSQEEMSCAFVDLSALGATQVSDRQWYQGLTYQILESLDLDEFDLDGWWNKYESLAPIDCFSRLIDDVILQEITNQLVIFIDEIDSIINLNFKDDFFALIRFFYNKKNVNYKYQRLTFCLLGVATPPDLIEDKSRTPFNIGRPIELNGFTFVESKTALVPGLSQVVKQPEETLKQVIDWTAGQPFLTQKLCYLIAEKANNEQPDVAAIVKQYVIEDWESQDYPQHFRTIRDRLLFDKNIAFKLLDTYQQILESDSITAEDSKIHSKLRFTGLVVKREGKLQVYNPIYREIFNADWIQTQLSNLRPYSTQLDRWLSSQKSLQYLLSDAELKQALEWAENKSLTRQDYEYLSDSKEAKARQELKEVEKEKNRIVERGKQSLLGIIMIAIAILAGTTWYANRQRNEAKKYEFEQQSNAISQEFNRGEQLAALSKAISLNNSLKKFNQNKSIVKYSTIKPIETLNNILQQIDEKQEIKLDSNNSALAYIPNLQSIIVGGEDGTLYLWNLQNSRVAKWNTLQNKGQITDIVISPDHRKIYVASKNKDAGINVINLSGELEKSFNTSAEITSLNITDDGEYIISGDRQGKVIIRKTNGTIVKTWQAHQLSLSVEKVAINQNNLIATIGNEPVGKLWTLDGIASFSGKEFGHRDIINDIAFSPDGKTIATASNDNQIKLWNLDGGSIDTLSGHEGSVKKIVFSSDGNNLVSISSDRTIKLWDVSTGSNQTVVGQQANLARMIFMSDINTIVVADNLGKIEVWQIPQTPTSRIGAASFINGKQHVLLSGFRQNTIETFADKQIKEIPNFDNKFINTVAVDKDGHTVIAGTEDGIVARLNIDRDRQWQAFAGSRYEGKVITVDFHPQAKKFITLGREQTEDRVSYPIKEWTLDGKTIKSLNPQVREEITAIKYSPQGDIAIATNQGEIKLLNEDGTIADTLLSSNKENITSISFSADNQLLAIATQDGLIQLYNLAGELLAEFTQDNGYKIVALEFSVDNQTIRSIDSYGTISNWYLNPDTLIQQGCKWLSPNFSDEDTDNEAAEICSQL